MKTDNRCQVTSMWYCFGRLCVDKCSEPAKEEGTCYDYVLRYSYVSSSGECEPFYYGGCEGNDNRFESTDECEAECMTPTTTSRPQPVTHRPHVVTPPHSSQQAGLSMKLDDNMQNLLFHKRRDCCQFTTLSSIGPARNQWSQSGRTTPSSVGKRGKRSA